MRRNKFKILDSVIQYIYQQFRKKPLLQQFHEPAENNFTIH